jgi:MFS family permease
MSSALPQCGQVTWIGVALRGVAFVVAENRVRWPLVELALLRDAQFAAVVLAGTISNVAYAVTIYLATLNLQEVQGLSPLTAGLAFLGPSIGAAIGGALSGRLAEKYDRMTVLGTGGLLAAISLVALAVSPLPVGYLVALTAGGFSMGLVYAFTTVATQALVPAERAGAAAGVALTSLITVAGVGVAVSGTTFETLSAAGMSAAAAISAILLVLAGVLALASVSVLALRR